MRETVHASCVLLGEIGILILGRPGAGKSALARALVEMPGGNGRFARLVADDVVRLAAEHDRLVARPHPNIAGLQEIRGVGVVPVQFEDAAVVRLVVRLQDAGVARMPADGEQIVLCGLTIPLLALEASRSPVENAGLVRFRVDNARNF